MCIIASRVPFDALVTAPISITSMVPSRVRLASVRPPSLPWADAPSKFCVENAIAADDDAGNFGTVHELSFVYSPAPPDVGTTCPTQTSNGDR